MQSSWALDGLAPRRRRSRASRHSKAESKPIVRVVLDIQAAHLGQTFDYLIDEKDSAQAQPARWCVCGSAGSV